MQRQEYTKRNENSRTTEFVLKFQKLKRETTQKNENLLINSYLTKNHDKLILTKSNHVKYAAFASKSR